MGRASVLEGRDDGVAGELAPTVVRAPGQPPDRHRHQRSHWLFSTRRIAALAGATLLVMAGEVASWLLARSQVVVFGDDSPGYLTAAQSLAHATLNPLPAYYRDMASHAIYNWSPNVPIHMVKGVHAYISGSHGPVFA
jgi:hypothetical protein